MKKTILISIAIFCLANMGMGQAITGMSMDWSYDGSGVGWSSSRGAYNMATGNFLICDYSAKAVRIASGTDGTLTGGTLSTAGLNFAAADTLGVFSICCTTDGVIYGGIANKSDGVTAGSSLVRWANQAATPTQQDPAPLGAIELTFIRTFDVKGTGTDTKIVVIGANYDAPQILTTTDGTTFAITDVGIGPDILTGIGKSGVALKSDGLTVYGAQADGSNWVRRQDKIASVWTNNTTFDTGVDDTNVLTALGFADGLNVLFALETHFNTAPTIDNLVALDGDTGAQIAAVDLGVFVAQYGYGQCDIDESNKKVYFAARGSNGINVIGDTGYCCGVATYTTPAPPPVLANVTSVWGLYE